MADALQVFRAGERAKKQIAEADEALGGASHGLDRVVLARP
jgi:hypothetical protein